MANGEESSDLLRITIHQYYINKNHHFLQVSPSPIEMAGQWILIVLFIIIFILLLIYLQTRINIAYKSFNLIMDYIEIIYFIFTKNLFIRYSIKSILYLDERSMLGINTTLINGIQI